MLNKFLHSPQPRLDYLSSHIPQKQIIVRACLTCYHSFSFISSYHHYRISRFCFISTTTISSVVTRNCKWMCLKQLFPSQESRLQRMTLCLTFMEVFLWKSLLPSFIVHSKTEMHLFSSPPATNLM